MVIEVKIAIPKCRSILLEGFKGSHINLRGNEIFKGRGKMLYVACCIEEDIQIVFKLTCQEMFTKLINQERSGVIFS